MAELRKGDSQYDLVLDATGVDPIYLVFDRDRTKNGKPVPFEIAVRYAPAESTAVRDWTWEPGSAGAGNSRETPASQAGGGSDFGKFVNLRRLGVAQPAGVMTEVDLPASVKALTSAYFIAGLEYGSSQDFYLATRDRYVLRIPNGTGGPEIAYDAGAGSQTTALAIFSGSGTDTLYAANPTGTILAFDGTSWTTGEAGTARTFFAVPHWTLGPSLATGGLAGTGGTAAHRLVGTNSSGTGFYHVAGDPKVAANWSALTPVGTGGALYPIVGVTQSNTVVWFGRTNGVHGVDSLGYSPNLTQWMTLATSVQNNRAIAYWNGLIWAGTEYGLMAFAPDGSRADLGTFVQFGAQGSNTSPIFGRPRALAPSPEGLYVGYFGDESGGVSLSSYVGLLKFSDSQYHWSMAEAVIPDNEEVTFIQQTSPGGEPRLWIGTINNTTARLHLYWQDLAKSGDPELDILRLGTYNARASWEMTLSRWNGGTSSLKAVRQLILEADGLGPGFPANTVEIQIASDGGTFTRQGTATTQNWSAEPIEDSLLASSFQVRLVVTNDPLHPVILRSFTVRYSPRPPLTRYTTYLCKFGQEVTGQDAAATLYRLEQLQKSDSVTCLDHLGNTVNWLIEPGLDETFTEESPEKPWVGRVTLTVSQTGAVARFDESVFESAAFS